MLPRGSQRLHPLSHITISHTAVQACVCVMCPQSSQLPNELTEALTATALMSWSCPVKVCWHWPTRISHSWREEARLIIPPTHSPTTPLTLPLHSFFHRSLSIIISNPSTEDWPCVTTKQNDTWGSSGDATAWQGTRDRPCKYTQRTKD